MTDLIDRDGFRANVGVVLMQADGRVFLGKRAGGKGWQFPQGGLRIGESVEQGMFRELAEEIGLAPEDVRIVGVTRRWLRYRLPPRYQRRDQLPLCIGQKQRWYLLESLTDAPPVRFDQTDEPEFCGWRWSHWWEPVREVIHFKRPVYRRALHELGQFAFPAGLPPYPEWWDEMASS